MLIFTSCITNYLPKARTLAQSLKSFHPAWHFCLILAESSCPPAISANEPFDSLLTIPDLNIPSWQSWMFQYDLVEMCTAIKGAALHHFLHYGDEEKIIYLDPDIMVLNSLSPLEHELEVHDILLTPHQITPQKNREDILTHELCSLQHGVFNLGFLACANRREGREFSNFWWERLKHWCKDDKQNGLFTDQKWCDLAPAFFPSLGIIHDPGYNVASWNLSERTISRSREGAFLSNNSLLRFYHFTGHDSGAGRADSARHLAAMPALSDLWNLYDSKLEKNGQSLLKQREWPGNFFANGQTISKKARLHYSQKPNLQLLYPDPYATDPYGTSGYAGYCKRHGITGNSARAMLAAPVGLFRLTRNYIARHGGIKGCMKLAGRVYNIWRNGGFTALAARITAFRAKTELDHPRCSLGDILSQKMPGWRETIATAFADKRGVLVLDHQYGGGANEYRKKRIRQFTASGKPCLLLTWDLSASRLNCKFFFTDGTSLEACEKDVLAIGAYPELQFGHILVNELVLWSLPGQKNPYDALPSLIQGILKLKQQNSSFLETAIHDFYPVCPNYTLLENGQSFCHIPHDKTRCASCLKYGDKNNFNNFNIEKWRDAWQHLLDNSDEIRFFSESSYQIFKRGFNQPLKKIKIVPHEPLEYLAPVMLPSNDLPLCIGVLGNIATHKGASIVREMAAALKPDEKMVIIGDIETGLPGRVKITGSYKRKELPELCRKYGVTCILVPSIWPETFCYTAREAIQLDLPLITFPLGAQAEHASNYVKGKVADNISAQAALSAIRQMDKLRTDISI